MEKVLLANSLLDQVETLYLIGQVGLAAVHALDIPVGVDGEARYGSFKPFILKLFEKAAAKGV
jgi:hypothetical protein